MKSGLEDRNNGGQGYGRFPKILGLNEVRPGRPEQYGTLHLTAKAFDSVSMKSGLEDRNNPDGRRFIVDHKTTVSMKSGLEDRNNWQRSPDPHHPNIRVSMKSGLEDRNNPVAV